MNNLDIISSVANAERVAKERASDILADHVIAIVKGEVRKTKELVVEYCKHNYTATHIAPEYRPGYQAALREVANLFGVKLR